MNGTSPKVPPSTMASGFPLGPNSTAYGLITSQFASRIVPNENGYFTPSSLWSCPPSPTSSIDTNKAGESNDECSHSSASAAEGSADKASPKGGRANRYKNCSETVLSKRRAQNRANQRAYRKRKEQRLEELQHQIDDMNQKNDALCCAYRLLANECCRLRAGQMCEQSPANWNVNGGGSLILDVAALEAYRSAPMSASSPMPESYLDYPETPDKLWSPY